MRQTCLQPRVVVRTLEASWNCVLAQSKSSSHKEDAPGAQERHASFSAEPLRGSMSAMHHSVLSTLHASQGLQVMCHSCYALAWLHCFGQARRVELLQLQELHLAFPTRHPWKASKERNSSKEVILCHVHLHDELYGLLSCFLCTLPLHRQRIGLSSERCENDDTRLWLGRGPPFPRTE